MKKVIALLLLTIALAGCSSTATTFQGQSPSWKAEYVVEEKENNLERTLLLTYKGDVKDLEEADMITYSLESESAEAAGEYELTGDIRGNKTFTFEVASQSDKVEDETEVIDVMVKLGRNLETFQLH